MTTPMRRLSSDLLATLPAWVVARLLVGVSWVVARLVSDELAGAGPDRIGRGLMAWDADWYRSLVVGGYDALPLEGVRFFPGFILLSRLADALLPGGPTTAMVVVANLGSLLAGVALYRLVLAETADRQLADRSVWLLACFPAAFVLVWGYAEGPFLAASIAAFLALRRRNWWMAAGLAAAAGLIRPTGILLAIPALLAAGSGWSGCTSSEKLRRGLAVMAAPVGAGAFVAWASVHFDDPLVPLTIQGELRGEAVDPASRLLDGLSDLFGPETLGDGLHAPFALVFLVLGILVLRSWPARYGVYALACLLVALCAQNLNSFERYALNGFPIVFGLAALAGHRRFGRAVPILSAAGLVALSVLAWTDIYVP